MKCQAIISDHHFEIKVRFQHTFLNARISLGGHAKNSDIADVKVSQILFRTEV